MEQRDGERSLELEARVPDPDPRVGVVIAAAGAGRRMGGAKKQYLELEGEPLLLRALRPFLALPDVVALVVVVPPEDAEAPPPWLREVDPRVEVVSGGETRAASVRRGIEALPDGVGIVVVHDGARPLVEAELVRRCVERAATGVGAVAAVPVTDTIKEVGGEVVEATLERARLWRAQTPQAFPAGMIRAAYAAGGDGTDDASLVEAGGGRVVIVRGSERNLKVTRPEDLELARFWLRRTEAARPPEEGAR